MTRVAQLIVPAPLGRICPKKADCGKECMKDDNEGKPRTGAERSRYGSVLDKSNIMAESLLRSRLTFQYFNMCSSFETGLQRYIHNLGTKKTSGHQIASVAEIEIELQSLHNSRIFRSRTHRFLRAVDPLIQFLSRYATAVDAMVQYDVNPSALVWGTLKVILIAARSYSIYMGSLIDTITQLVDCIVPYGRYEHLFSRDKAFHTLLSDVYFDVLVFLEKAKSVCKRNAASVFFKGIWTNFEQDFRDTLQNLSRHKSLLEAKKTLCHIEHVEGEIKDQASYRQHSSKAFEQLLETSSRGKSKLNYSETDDRGSLIRWLAPSDASEDLWQALEKRTQDTNQWIFYEPILLNWLRPTVHRDKDRLAWIHGAPGCGKTILSASVIEHLQLHNADPTRNAVCYFYCDTRDNRRKTTLDVARTLLRQLLAQSANIPEELHRVFRSAIASGREQLSMSDRPYHLLSGISAAMDGLCVVVDGIDECDDPAHVGSALRDFCFNNKNVRLMCFSRDMPSARACYGMYSNLKMTPDLTRGDIDKYLEVAIQSLPDTDHTVRTDTFNQLSSLSNGMFLWVRLMIQGLSVTATPSEMRNALCQLPVGLDITYQRILERLGRETPERKALAKNVLTWVCCSMRPLTLSELQNALSWDVSTGTFPGSNAPFVTAVIGVCSPLVEIRQDDSTLRLVHSSVRDYLCKPCSTDPASSGVTQYSINTIEGHRWIAEACCDYLSLPSVNDSIKPDQGIFPFVEYATVNWCQHVESSRHDQSLSNKVAAFLSSPHRRRTWNTRFMLLRKTAFPLQELVRLQCSVVEWIRKAAKDDRYWVDDLADLHHFLFGNESPRRSIIHGHPPQTNFNFETLLTFRDLSREYTRRGRLEDGVKWLQQSLDRIEHAHGPHSIHSAWLLNGLGILFDQQDKVAVAAKTQEQALDLQENWLGQDHPQTVLTVNELGRVYRHMGEHEKSERMHLRALEALGRSLPDDDLQIVWTLNTLGRNYLKQNRISEAVKLHEQALASQQRMLGKEHPHTLWTMTDVARCHCDQGKLEEALVLQKTVIDVRSRVLGSHHADTMWSMNSLALVLEGLGRKDEATSWHHRALKGQIVYLGYDHRHTKWTRKVLERLS